MRRGKFRRIGIAMAGAVVVLLVIVILERARGARELRDVLERVRSAKIELNVGRLTTHSAPDAENGAVALLQITNELQTFALPVEVGAIPLMKLTAPGRARSVIGSESWPGAGGESFRWEQLERAHQEALGLFEKLLKISKLPRFASPLDATEGVADMEIGSLTALPAVMRVLRVVAAYDLHQGNDERAEEAVIALLNIFPNKSEDRWNIAEAVRWSYARLGMSLTWELLQHAELPDENWKRLQIAWEKCDFLDSYAKAARMEIAGVSDYFVRLKSSAAYRENILGKFELIERDFGASWNPPMRGEILRRVHLPLWRLLWAEQDYAYSMEYRATEVDLAEFARSNSWDATRDEAINRERPNEGMEGPEAGERNLYDRARYLFSFTPEPILKMDLLRAYQAQTEASLAVAAISLQRYFIEQGKYPVNLQELRPRYVAEVRRDPMDGGMLKYRVLEEGGYVLYSSGVDGEDDGGVDEEAGGEGILNLWSAEDVIWPRRANE